MEVEPIAHLVGMTFRYLFKLAYHPFFLAQSLWCSYWREELLMKLAFQALNDAGKTSLAQRRSNRVVNKLNALTCNASG